MKALSLWQPYASLIASGKKVHETRSWAAPSWLLGRQLVIHAAKRAMTQCEQKYFFYDEWTQKALYPLFKPAGGVVRAESLPYGAAVCVARLVACVPTERVPDGAHALDFVFGDFSAGRFAWRFEDVRVFPEPILLRGAQGIFDVPDDVMRAMSLALSGEAYRAN